MFKEWFAEGREYRIGPDRSGLDIQIQTRNPRALRFIWKTIEYSEDLQDAYKRLDALRFRLPLKPSDAYQFRIIKIDPPTVGAVSLTKYPFRAQLRLRSRHAGLKWSDYTDHETIEAAEKDIQHFKDSLDKKAIQTVVRYVG